MNHAAVGLRKLLEARIHYEMRAAVDNCRKLQSAALMNRASTLVASFPADVRAVVSHQIRWVREYYPFPPLLACDLNRAAGARKLFTWISVGLNGDTEPSDEHLTWLSEIEGGFLRAQCIAEMQVAAMHYPILLRDSVQLAIWATIEVNLSEQMRSDCSERLSWLRQLREQPADRHVSDQATTCDVSNNYTRWIKLARLMRST
jgi:hypothetical protein